MGTKSDVFLASHPTEIFLALDTFYKDDPWISWEPETLLTLMKGELSQEAQDKVLAVQAMAANTEEVLSSGIAYEKTVMAFCNNICVMDVQQPPYVEEMTYATKHILSIAKLVHKDRPKQIYFRDEVPGYVAATAKYRGWFMLPHPLEFAQTALDSLNGFSEKSDRRREYGALYKQVFNVFHKMMESDAEDILASGEIKELSGKDDTSAVLVRQVLGALLYDPTIVYRK